MYLSFVILSDTDHKFDKAMNLPMFEAEGMKFHKRLKMIVHHSTVIKTFYPVFPPDKNSENVINWLKSDET